MKAALSSNPGVCEETYGQADVWEVNGDQESPEQKQGGKGGKHTHV